MEDKEPNNRSKAESMELRCICVILLGMFILGCSMPLMYIMDNNSVPVLKTVNKDDNNKEYADTYEIWETEESGGTDIRAASVTSVPARDDEPVTCVTVVFPIDVNAATAEELMMVRGIGEVLAQRIIEYRKINGYFYSMEELLDVEGIGEKKLASFEGYLYINYDMLPAAIPQSQPAETGAAVYRDNSVSAETAATTVPKSKVPPEKTTVTARTSAATEEFIMETVEFVTDKDVIDYSTDVYNTEKTKTKTTTEKTKTQKTTETEYYPDFPLELNTASVKDLTYIKGIGESTAKKIVNYARTYGFSDVDDLLNISGIGQSKLEAIRPYVYVNSSGVTKITSNTTAAATVSTPEYTTTPFSEQTTQTAQTTTQAEIPRINLNTCGIYDLMQIPFISEETAEKIIELRNEIGGFYKIEELAYVLSNEQLYKISDYVYL